MEELEAILTAKNDNDMAHWRFQASLKGINLDEEIGEQGESFSLEDKIREYQATQGGMSKEAYELAEIGIVVESE